MTKADRIDKLEAIRKEQNAKIEELQAEVERLRNHMRDAIDKLETVDSMMRSEQWGQRGFTEQRFDDALFDLTSALDAAEDSHESQ